MREYGIHTKSGKKTINKVNKDTSSIVNKSSVQTINYPFNSISLFVDNDVQRYQSDVDALDGHISLCNKLVEEKLIHSLKLPLIPWQGPSSCKYYNQRNGGTSTRMLIKLPQRKFLGLCSYLRKYVKEVLDLGETKFKLSTPVAITSSSINRQRNHRQSAGDYHRDWWGKDANVYTVMVGISNHGITKGLGGVKIWLDSHKYQPGNVLLKCEGKRNRNKGRRLDDMFSHETFVLNFGDVLIFDSRLFHRSTLHTSTDDRMIISYTVILNDACERETKHLLYPRY
jgi:hypothetical protein